MVFLLMTTQKTEITENISGRGGINRKQEYSKIFTRIYTWGTSSCKFCLLLTYIMGRNGQVKKKQNGLESAYYFTPKAQDLSALYLKVCTHTHKHIRWGLGYHTYYLQSAYNTYPARLVRCAMEPLCWASYSGNSDVNMMNEYRLALKKSRIHHPKICLFSLRIFWADLTVFPEQY